MPHPEFGDSGTPWPRVSVVIPTWNRAAWIADAIFSVLDQNYPNLEVIVVDDGSTDETAAVVRRFGHEVRYVRQENGGPASARNRGIRTATGEFVAFLDSDDLFETGKLHEQVQYFRRNPEAILVYCWFSIVDECGRKRLGRRCNLSGLVADALLARCMQGPIATPTVMVRRSALLESGGFDEGMSLSEDIDLWCRLARLGPIGLIPEVLVRVRRHGANVSRGAGRRRYLAAALRIIDKSGEGDSLSHLKRLRLKTKAHLWSWLVLVGGLLPAGTSFWLRALLTNPLALLRRQPFPDEISQRIPLAGPDDRLAA